MRIVAFDAQELRGVATALRERGHDVRVNAPDAAPDLDGALDGADLVLVHEGTEPRVVEEIGEHHARTGGYRLLFHDTHHRAVTAPHELARFHLEQYDGVLTSGAAIRELYVERGWAERAWTWHPAADTAVFRPLDGVEREQDLVWAGDWREDGLDELVLEPARRLRLSGSIHGARVPWRTRLRIRRSGLRPCARAARHRLPELFARHRVTVHAPATPSVPSIRPFEALACGIPLVCAPWDDADSLLRPGTDHLVARDGREMRDALRAILDDDGLAAGLRERGLETIRDRHTCGHRADELLAIHAELDPAGAAR